MSEHRWAIYVSDCYDGVLTYAAGTQPRTGLDERSYSLPLAGLARRQAIG